MHSVTELEELGLTVKAEISTYSVYFENIYGDNLDNRKQRVLQKADPFSICQLADVDARIFHLGPLLADDISLEIVKRLSTKGKISLDAQGYLRRVENQQVLAVDWPEKYEALQYIHTLKVNEHELEVLSNYSDLHAGAKVLANLGVKEVVITLGSMGSLIYAEGNFHDIPAYTPAHIIDATGCGDTYMAAYLARRIKGDDIEQAGRFASAMAALKIENAGPFRGSEEDVREMMRR
jgi:sugar/nucleoside kinase (ribokinase family)